MQGEQYFTKSLYCMWAPIVLLGGTAAYGQTLLSPPVDSYSAVRLLGMGQAFVGVADDENAVFSNPAGIGHVFSKKSSKSLSLSNATFPNLTIISNMYGIDLVGNYFSGSEKPSQDAQKALANAPSGQIVYGRASIFPNFIFGRFQLGLLADGFLNGRKVSLDESKTSDLPQVQTPNRTVYDRTFKVFSRRQAGIVSGFSLPFFYSSSIGIGVRAMGRMTSITSIPMDKDGFLPGASQQAADLTNQSAGAGVDVGILMPLGRRTGVKLGVAARDVGDTTWQPVTKTSVKEIDKMNLASGLSYARPLGKYLEFLVSTEYERINDLRVESRNKLRAGSELQFRAPGTERQLFSLRAGYGAGGMSGGVTLDMLFAKVDLATYQEAVETEQGTVSDRRYAAKITVELNK